MRFLIRRFIAVIPFLMVTAPSWAVPVLSFDLDLSTPGIQSSRSVLLGDNLTAAVVLSNYDANTLFDTVSFDVNFNDSGTTLASAGGPAAGALVDMAPVETWDGFSFTFTDIDEGDALSTLSFGGAPGFQSNFGYFLYSSVTDPFSLSGSDPITVATFDFTAVALGSSLLDMAVNPAALSFAGNPLETSLVGGRIDVIAAVSEPGVFLLFGAGLIGLWLARLRNC